MVRIVVTESTAVSEQRTTPIVSRNCDGILKFEATEIQPQEVHTFDYNTSAINADDCAMNCYQRQCGSALYIPSAQDCQMNLRDYVCPPEPALTFRFGSDKPAVLKCFTCSKLKCAREGTVKNFDTSFCNSAPPGPSATTPSPNETTVEVPTSRKKKHRTRFYVVVLARSNVE